MKPYTIYCQNDDCQEELEVEITYFRPEIPMVWADLWENSSPGEPAEIEYQLPTCHKCGTKQEDSVDLEEELVEYASDRDEDYDDEC